MTKTKIVQEQTVHGSIEYTVMECDSCGQDVMEEEANEFTLGDREGYACDVCVDEGPVGFPPQQTEEYPFFAIAVFSVFFPLMPLFIFDAISTRGVNEKDALWFAGALGAILWMGGSYWLSMGGFL